MNTEKNEVIQENIFLTSLTERKSLRLTYTDYDVPCLNLAENLLGYYLCRRLDSGEEVRGMIVETESYLGGDDKASHSFAGKKTERNAAMFMKPGTAYVYSTYGMYFCFNISSKGDGAAVLIRALQPTLGLETIQLNRERYQRRKANNNSKKQFNISDLCNGPSKLCMSFDIDKSLNKEDMITSMKIWIEKPLNFDIKNDITIISCPRIGINSVGINWASKPLRFYIYGNPYVSKKDRKAEQHVILK